MPKMSSVPRKSSQFLMRNILSEEAQKSVPVVALSEELIAHSDNSLHQSSGASDGSQENEVFDMTQRTGECNLVSGRLESEKT